MKIEMYDSDRGTKGYKLIGETEEEKLILGSIRNNAYFTDGKLIYEGVESKDGDREKRMASSIMFAHNVPLEQRVEAQSPK